MVGATASLRRWRNVQRRRGSRTTYLPPYRLWRPSPLRSQPARTVQAVGREAELSRLHHWLQQALGGTRQVVFVTGEAGFGKTTLVETFLQELDGYGALWIGHGQCIEHYGAGEAYLPVLEALGSCVRSLEGRRSLPS